MAFDQPKEQVESASLVGTKTVFWHPHFGCHWTFLDGGLKATGVLGQPGEWVVRRDITYTFSGMENVTPYGELS